MTDQKMDEVAGVGFKLRGSLPPGRVDLAWGYDLRGTRLTLRLYDPNRPGDDQVALTLDTAHPRQVTPVRCTRGDSVCCFFRTDYEFRDPGTAFAKATKSAWAREWQSTG